MKPAYEKLFAPVHLNDSVTLPNRFVMSPMVVNGSTEDGDVTDVDVTYFERRAQTASLLITGAAHVARSGHAFRYGLGVDSDTQIPGLARLARAAKSAGARAILQIFHAGREAKSAQRAYSIAYGPSDDAPDFLPYPVTGMTDRHVREVIADFGEATRRAIEAGFDGVEIHGANHYLLQQFFSASSNRRDDHWGGSVEARMNFPLAVLECVKRTARELKPDFIIGYRLSPEEIHGDTVGYGVDESLQLAERIADQGVDYIHLSQWGPRGYASQAKIGSHRGEIITDAFSSLCAGRTLVAVASDITSAEKAADAATHADLVALASAALCYPDFVQAIAAGREDEITMDVRGRVADLVLPQSFGNMATVLRGSGSVPEETIEALRAYANGASGR